MSKAAIILAAGPGSIFPADVVFLATSGLRPEKCDQDKKMARHG